MEIAQIANFEFNTQNLNFVFYDSSNPSNYSKYYIYFFEYFCFNEIFFEFINLELFFKFSI